MSGDWPTATIGEIAKVARGGSPRPITKFITNEPDGVNWIKIGDTEKGGRYITGTAEKIIRDGIKRSRWVDEGDFLLTNSMSFGRPYILKTSGCIHDGWLVLKPDYKRINQDFLYYALSSPTTFAQFDAAAAGSTVRNLNIGLVEKVRIPLPPLEEQKRIVAVLDQAFAALDRARTLAEANLADAEELFEAQLDAALGQADGEWISATLDSLCSKIGSGATPKGGSASYRSEGISLIRSLNVYDREFREDKLAFIGEEQARKLDIVTVKAGDVLFNITGASVARCCIAPTHLLPARVNQHVAILRPDRSRLMPDFLCLLLTTRTMKDRLLKVGNEGGATRQAITKAQLQALTVSFPSSLEKQCDIIDDLKHQNDQCLSLRSTYQKTLIDLADLRQSLLQKAFAGELT